MAKLFRMAKIAGGRPHRFRHTFALAVVVAGTPIDQVSVLLWRRSIKVTIRNPMLYPAELHARAFVISYNIVGLLRIGQLSRTVSHP